MKWYIECWKKYAVFSGRARRKEYWMFVLFNILVGAAIGFVFGLIGMQEAGMVVSWLYSLASLLPGLAVTVRRLHDTGRSGTELLMVIIPLCIASAMVAVEGRYHGCGALNAFDMVEISFCFLSLALSIFFLVILCRRGDDGANEYGERPAVE